MKYLVRRLTLLVCAASLLPCPASTLAAAASTPAAAAATGAKLTFRRVFKSSTPEFIEITVRADSDSATYEIRQMEDDPGASPFEVSPTLPAKMFQLTG